MEHIQVFKISIDSKLLRKRTLLFPAKLLINTTVLSSFLFFQSKLSYFLSFVSSGAVCSTHKRLSLKFINDTMLKV